MAIERETDDDRREMAMAVAAASLRPNFKPKSGIAATQLSKFQELHKRRLQIKAKSKANKSGKGESHRKRSEAKEKEEPGDSVGESPSSPILRDTPSVEESNLAGNSVANKGRKLHWGLDTKERWEQKSNM